MHKLILLLLLVACLVGATAYAQAPAALPTGDNGIAKNYPNDAGIAGGAGVMLFDDFESYTSPSGMTAKWSNVFGLTHLRIATESGHFFAGAKGLEMKVPAGAAQVSNGAEKIISPTQDVLFTRMYIKYSSTYNASGSVHNLISITANYCCAGTPANGTNKFEVDMENSRDLPSNNPGNTNSYVYYPEQRDVYGDHWYPNGTVLPNSQTPGNFGPYFVSRPQFVPTLNQWYSFELMAKANTPGVRDGRVAIWVDGNLIADFLNVRLRDVSTLKIDKATLQQYLGTAPAADAILWCDNVVMARSYIGPMYTGAAAVPPNAPTNLTATPH